MDCGAIAAQSRYWTGIDTQRSYLFVYLFLVGLFETRAQYTHHNVAYVYLRY